VPAGNSGPTPEDRLVLTGDASKTSCSILDDNNERSVDTAIPGTIKRNVGSLSIASVGCQKAGAQGTMTLQLYVNGNLEASGTTSAQYGLVNLTYPK
jgi:hypothetical protein